MIIMNYQVGKLIFNLIDYSKNQSIYRLIPFVCESNNYNVSYTIKYVNNLYDIYKEYNLKLGNDIYYYQENNFDLCVYHQNNQVFAVCKEENDITTIYLDRKIKDEEWHDYFLLDLLHLERRLIHKDSYVLHASFICHNHEAILFTAPSGGGKTTQANLWINHKNARMINGDKVIVGKEGHTWYAYGLPISGSSEYYLNEKYKIKAIVILDKYKENQLFNIGIQGFHNIFSQSISNLWDIDYTNKLIDLVQSSCNEIPIYYYRCTKEKDAVEVLYQKLYKE